MFVSLAKLHISATSAIIQPRHYNLHTKVIIASCSKNILIKGPDATKKEGKANLTEIVYTMMVLGQ